MKLMIASDIHGSAMYCKNLMEAFDREKADRLLLLGDILYHGPRNDLPKDYAPKKVIELLNGIKNEILCVRGNCDTEVDQMVLEFPVLADYAVIFVDGKTLYLTHGHKYNPNNLPPIKIGDRLVYATHGHNFNLNNLPPLCSGDILLHGHTHIPAWEEFGENNLYLNPGSVSIPKENSAHGYMLLENEEFIWKTLDGEEYHSLKI